MTADPPSRLARRLGLADAVLVGLAAMLGTGVFVVWAPAAAEAGSALLLGLGVAALAATANALSSAQLAAQHPQAGGAYAYGRARLGPTWGALAGYAFVAGKTASCSVAALAVGTALWPARAPVVAVAVVAVMAAVDAAGVHRTAAVNRFLVAGVLVVLGLVAAAGLFGPTTGSLADGLRQPTGGLPGVLGAAAVLFYAFAGYARVTVLGEEVRDPARTIPRAVVVALVVVLAVYVAVGLSVLTALGPQQLAATTLPLVDAVRAAGVEGLAPWVRAATAVAAGGALLSLLAGTGRTVFAMAAQGDLPRGLAQVHAGSAVPRRAGFAVALVAAVGAATGALVPVVRLSACLVLVYYTVMNLAALRLRPDERLVPRAVAVVGLVGCVALALALPPAVVAATVVLLAGLLAVRATLSRARRQAPGPS